MKKLMFVAAMVGSTVAFGETNLDDFIAEDGIYNVTFSEKAFVVGGTVNGEDIIMEGDTKSEALAAANEEFDSYKEDTESYPNAKKKSTKTIYDNDNEVYVCTIKWTYTSDESVTDKIATKSYAGILIKGNYAGDYVKNGTLMLWSKSKDGVYFGPEVRKIGAYEAYEVDDATFTGFANGKKSVGTMAYDYAEGTVQGVGFGTAKDENVKSISGQVLFCAEDALKSGYGTWKIQKDATATKMAENDYSLERILNKKGATEFHD